jgi:hypothetical protein
VKVTLANRVLDVAMARKICSPVSECPEAVAVVARLVPDAVSRVELPPAAHSLPQSVDHAQPSVHAGATEKLRCPLLNGAGKPCATVTTSQARLTAHIWGAHGAAAELIAEIVLASASTSHAVTTAAVDRHQHEACHVPGCPCRVPSLSSQRTPSAD